MSEIEERVERVTRFEQAMDRYDHGADERKREAASKTIADTSKRERREVISRTNEQTKQFPRKGTPLDAVFGAGDAAVCEAFIKRMRKEDFPGSALLENKIVNQSTSGRLLRRLSGRQPQLEPFSIRGYQIGVVQEKKPLSGTNGLTAEEYRAYLCEDGKLRAYSVDRLASVDSFDDSEIHRVHDLPLDVDTGQPEEIVPVHGDSTHAEYGEITVHTVEDMLLSHMMSEAYAQSQEV